MNYTKNNQLIAGKIDHCERGYAYQTQQALLMDEWLERMGITQKDIDRANPEEYIKLNAQWRKWANNLTKEHKTKVYNHCLTTIKNGGNPL